MVAALANEDLWERGGSYGSRVGKMEDGGGWKEMGRIRGSTGREGTV